MLVCKMEMWSWGSLSCSSDRQAVITFMGSQNVMLFYKRPKTIKASFDGGQSNAYNYLDET